MGAGLAGLLAPGSLGSGNLISISPGFAEGSSTSVLFFMAGSGTSRPLFTFGSGMKNSPCPFLLSGLGLGLLFALLFPLFALLLLPFSALAGLFVIRLPSGPMP